MLVLEKVSKVYNEGQTNQKIALNNASLSIGEKELLAIIGKSGAGKSTLLKIIACLTTVSKGEYSYNGKKLSEYNGDELALFRNKTIGLVTQSPFLIEEISAIENVKWPLYINNCDKKQATQRATTALESVGLGENLSQRVSTLSGGEKQRVAIARALVNDPDIILADEPTGNLDSANSAEIMKILTAINEQGKTVIIITHDMDIARQCNRIITLSDGRIISDTASVEKRKSVDSDKF